LELFCQEIGIDYKGQQQDPSEFYYRLINAVDVERKRTLNSGDLSFMKLIEVNENFLKQDTKFESSGNVRKEYHFLQVEKVEEVSNIQSLFETKTEDVDEPN